MRRVAFLAACLVVAVVFIGGSCPSDPTVPNKPVGKATIYQNAPETYSTVSTSSKDVRYVFNWGDTKYDSTELVKGGETTGLSHTWLTAGTFKVSAMAINAEAKATVWSEELSITVTAHDKPPAPESIQGQTAGTPRDKILIWTRVTMPNATDSCYIQFRHASSSKPASAWLGPVPSGMYVYDTVKYATQGTYDITAYTKDVQGAVSEPSPLMKIIVGPVGLGWIRSTDNIDAFNFSPAIKVNTGSLTIYAVCDGDSFFTWTDDGTPKKMGVPVPDQSTFASSPVLSPDGNSVYIAAENGRLYSLDATSLDKKWHFEPDTMRLGFTTVSTNGSTIYAGRDDGKLFAINSNGTEKWQLLLGGSISYPAVIMADGRIIVGNDSSGVYCISDDGTAGTIVATNGMGGGVSSTPAIDAGGNIWVGCEDGRLWELNGSDSLKTVFMSDTANDNVVGSPVIGVDGTVYAVRGNGSVFAIRGGAQIWENTLANSYVSAAPCLAPDTTIIIHTEEGLLFAVQQSDGLKIWQFQLPDAGFAGRRFGGAEGSAPAIGPEQQRIYVGGDNAFYAVSVDKASYATTAPLSQWGQWPKFQHDLRNSGWYGGTWAH